MANLSKAVVNFLNKQNFVIVSSIDNDGFPHTSCKGLVDVSDKNNIYIFDLYRGSTYNNIKRNSSVSITVIDEEKFMGYCVKGTAHIISIDKASSTILKKWEDKIFSRISHRVVRHIKRNKHFLFYPEANMPNPEYIIFVEAEKVISLAPAR